MNKRRSSSTKTEPSDSFLRLTLIEAMPFVGNDSGIYVNLFNEIEKRAGIKTVREYGSWDSYATEEADVVLGHTFLNESVYADFGPVFYVDSLITIVPKPTDLFIRRNLSKIFSPEALPLVLIAYIIIVTLKLRIAKSKITKRLPFVVFMVSYYFYHIVFEAIYLSKLASVFGSPSKSLLITDEEVLYVNDYDAYAMPFFDRIARSHLRFNNKDWMEQHLHVVNNSVLDLFKIVSLSENHAVAGIFKSTLDIYPSDAMTVKTFVARELVNFRLFCTFHLRKGNILNPIIRYWALEIIEKGFAQKWFRDVSSTNRNGPTERRATETPGAFVAFSLEYYQEVYALLIAGYVFGLAVFALEFLAKDLEKKVIRMRKESRF